MMRYEAHLFLLAFSRSCCLKTVDELWRNRSLTTEDRGILRWNSNVFWLASTLHCDEHVCGIGCCLASLFVIEEVCILDDLVSTPHEVVVRKVSYSGFLYLAALFEVPVESLVRWWKKSLKAWKESSQSEWSRGKARISLVQIMSRL